MSCLLPFLARTVGQLCVRLRLSEAEALSRWQPARRAPAAPCCLGRWGQLASPRTRSPARGQHPMREGSWRRHQQATVWDKQIESCCASVSGGSTGCKNVADSPASLTRVLEVSCVCVSVGKWVNASCLLAAGLTIRGKNKETSFLGPARRIMQNSF